MSKIPCLTVKYTSFSTLMRLLALLLFILAIIGAGFAGLLQSFGHFQSIEHDFDGQCLPVTGVAGPEDIVIADNSGLAIISSLDRRDPEARGAIHLFDPADPLAAGGWKDMTNGVPKAFRPLGISYFEDDTHRRLFVVNEAINGVELFDIEEDGTLIHLNSFTERRLTSPNNIVGVGPTSFYVTNDVKPGRSSTMGTFHFLSRAASGEIFYSDGTVWQQVASGLKFANGIDISADGEQLYVAETTGKTVRAYNRNLATNAITPAREYEIPFLPDNIAVNEDGQVWVAGLPKPLSVPLHESDSTKLAPSQVAIIKRNRGIETVYQDDGSELSASTTATQIGSTLLIGALYENKFLLCDLPDTEI